MDARNTAFISEHAPTADEVLRSLTAIYTTSHIDSFVAFPSVGPAKRVKNLASLGEYLSLLQLEILDVDVAVIERTLIAAYDASSDIVTEGIKSQLSLSRTPVILIDSDQGQFTATTYMLLRSAFNSVSKKRGMLKCYQWCIVPHFVFNNESTMLAPCYTIKNRQWLHSTTNVRPPSPFTAYLLALPTASLGLQNWPSKLELIQWGFQDGKDFAAMTLGCHWLRQFTALDKVILTVIKISRGVAKLEEIRVGSAMNLAFLLPPPQGEQAPDIEGDIYLPIVAPKPVYGSLEQLLRGTELGWLAMDEVNINTEGPYLIGWAGLY